MYKTGGLCVHTGISGIMDKAAVHDHIKPLAGIVMLLLWCNPSIVRACVCLSECVRMNVSAAKPPVSLFILMSNIFWCRHWSISHCNCDGISLYWISAWETHCKGEKENNLNTICQIWIPLWPRTLFAYLYKLWFIIDESQAIKCWKLTCMRKYYSKICDHIFKTLFSEENVFCFRRILCNLQRST